MFFHLTELEHHPILFDVDYSPGEIRYSEELRQRGDLHAEGSAELLKNTLGEIRIRGSVRVEIESECHRCLEPALVKVDLPFDLFYRPVVKTLNHAEIHLDEGQIDISFYEGDGVSLQEVLREFVLLAMPMRFFCREDCRGICPVCGGNRNAVLCSCVVKPGDERWAALKNL